MKNICFYSSVISKNIEFDIRTLQPCGTARINLAGNNINNENVKVEISNISGQIVHKQTIENANSGSVHNFDLTSYKKGMYLIRIQTATTIKTEKIIIQ